jgi:hypothetical protein
MIRKLSVVSMVWVSALAAPMAFAAEEILPDRAVSPVISNDKLLISPIHSLAFFKPEAPKEIRKVTLPGIQGGIYGEFVHSVKNRAFIDSSV